MYPVPRTPLINIWRCTHVCWNLRETKGFSQKISRSKLEGCSLWIGTNATPSYTTVYTLQWVQLLSGMAIPCQAWQCLAFLQKLMGEKNKRSIKNKIPLLLFCGYLGVPDSMVQLSSDCKELSVGSLCEGWERIFHFMHHLQLPLIIQQSQYTPLMQS